MKMLMAILLLSVVPLNSWAQPTRNVTEYNLEDGVGLKGHDPVAIFPEGGGAAAMGKPEYSLAYDGVVYHFASEPNRDIFMQNPAKYEPTYGGWCAYAMASGAKVQIQPDQYTIHGSRAHYFVSARAKRNFDADVEGHETRADGFWKQISGEDPRL